MLIAFGVMIYAGIRIAVRAPDTIHLSDPGSDFVARWLMPQALGLAAPSQ